MYNMSNKDKFDYTYFLANTEFIKWRLLRTDELDAYWSDFIEKNPYCEEAIWEAIDKFKAVRLNKKYLSQEVIEELHEKIIRDSQKVISRRRNFKYYWSAAACIVLLIASVLFAQFINKIKEEVVPETIVGQALPSEDIKLISGSTVVEIGQNADLELLSEEDKVSIMKEGEIKSSEIDLSEQHNRLIVPYGKRSTLLLADGSKIWLNSGTELEFPTNFTSDERRINILKGEIYIEVAENKKSPFYVQTSEFDICVYGTKFNVSCYKNAEKSVVLVNGKVGIQSNKRNLILNPGELFSVNKGKIIHQKVDNVDEYTSWKDGMFIFKKITISDLLKKIGRYYNVDFENSQSTLVNRTCNGKLYLSEDMEQVMNIVCAITNTSYKKTGNTIYITDKESSKKY